MKRVLLIVLLLLVSVCNTWAAGRDVFIHECGSCHSSAGKAPPVNPGDKAAAVWGKYFKRHRHPVDLQEISPDSMVDVLTYLSDHAADSEQPESAAIPK